MEEAHDEHGRCRECGRCRGFIYSDTPAPPNWFAIGWHARVLRHTVIEEHTRHESPDGEWIEMEGIRCSCGKVWPSS